MPQPDRNKRVDREHSVVIFSVHEHKKLHRRFFTGGHDESRVMPVFPRIDELHKNRNNTWHFLN